MDYFSKLQHWVTKNKYQCFQQSAEDLFLKVDIFDFSLKRKVKSDLDKVKEEMNQLKQDKVKQDLKIKMFNMQFFCYWRDQQKDLIQRIHFDNTMIQDISQLYFTIEGNGFCFQGQNAVQSIQQDNISAFLEESILSDEASGSQFGFCKQPGGNIGLSQAISNPNPSSNQMTYCIGLKEQLSQEINHSIDIQLSGERNKKLFQVIIFGPGCKSPMIVKMSREVFKRDINASTQTYYYPIQVSVRSEQKYSIYIPRIFN
ncbi:UNKNOWN [Stylonychia lemnae]|uniref:Uncharacterized protein n=1 Tax=Stylonychia lemnae TaxID=5949 RepID=A0A078B511_STYLE|nr:UNKNOWN [Stylonychia lemnae]|eukprot:CDW89509.1 UNKNOWN [Stylonychia lemnae]